jgi:predicted TIM-barrel fold metal-dependent hydrolase
MHRTKPLLRAFLPFIFSTKSGAYSTMPGVIDSHLHIWASSTESSSFPYASDQDPPPSLQNAASADFLLKQMEDAGVDGALIVQPINHKFDHSYVADAIKKHPTKFKGMLLHDPSLSAEMAVDRLEQLVLQGFVGVRFNPYLWAEGTSMSTGAGLAVYKRCAELNLPVGIMCFKGLDLHYDKVVELIKQSPNTVCILDHMGFCALNEKGDKQFHQLLSLAQYQNVFVKISALFRNTGDVDSYPYDKLKTGRFDPLMEKFRADRLMLGTDFPFVTETEGGYKGAVETVKSWVDDEIARNAVMGGTAEKVFGKWTS